MKRSWTWYTMIGVPPHRPMWANMCCWLRQPNQHGMYESRSNEVVLTCSPFLTRNRIKPTKMFNSRYAATHLKIDQEEIMSWLAFKDLGTTTKKASTEVINTMGSYTDLYTSWCHGTTISTTFQRIESKLGFGVGFSELVNPLASSSNLRYPRMSP